jgi:hypothetical protein
MRKLHQHLRDVPQRLGQPLEAEPLEAETLEAETRTLCARPEGVSHASTRLPGALGTNRHFANRAEGRTKLAFHPTKG